MQPDSNQIHSNIDWYKDFFHGVALDMWRRAVNPQITQAESAFLEDVLEVPDGARILDVPCGNGRHSIALANRGYRMSGVDLADEFIQEARAVGSAAEFLRADMRELPWQAEFDGAFCLGNSFGYLDHAGTLGFLEAVSKALKPGAKFVLDTGCAAESILPALQTRGWMQLGDLLFLSSRSYNARESRLEMEYTFVRGGVSDTRQASTAVHTVAEIRRMLEAAGLVTRSLFGSFDKIPYALGSPRLLVVAEKA